MSNLSCSQDAEDWLDRSLRGKRVSLFEDGGVITSLALSVWNLTCEVIFSRQFLCSEIAYHSICMNCRRLDFLRCFIVNRDLLGNHSVAIIIISIIFLLFVSLTRSINLNTDLRRLGQLRLYLPFHGIWAMGCV